LTERPGIHPAPYVGRYSWVILDRLDALPREELKDLIRESYGMVAAKAPKVRPRNSVKAKKVKARTARKTRANRRRS